MEKQKQEAIALDKQLAETKALNRSYERQANKDFHSGPKQVQDQIKAKLDALQKANNKRLQEKYADID